jgi:hypothetical protein
MSDVHLSTSGPGETVLDPEPQEARDGLEAALKEPEDRRREAVSAVVGRHPRFLEGWAHLGETARDEVEAYADFRVGYHRLRASGWRGSGYVRWQHPENQGFLRCLQGLQRSATALGERDEADRCRHFLAQLDPNLVEPD